MRTYYFHFDTDMESDATIKVVATRLSVAFDKFLSMVVDMRDFNRLCVYNYTVESRYGRRQHRHFDCIRHFSLSRGQLVPLY